MKETEGDSNRWKDIPCSWIGRINTVKISYYPKQSTDSVQSLHFFFTNVEQQQEQNNLYGNTKDPEQPKQS